MTYIIPFIVAILVVRYGPFYYGNHKIEFDHDFLYFKQGVNIPLSSIHSIKLTEVGDIHNNRFWSICHDPTKSSTISLRPSLVNDSFAKFIQAVRIANPSVDADVFEFELCFGFIPKARWRPTKNTNNNV